MTPSRRVSSDPLPEAEDNFLDESPSQERDLGDLAALAEADAGWRWQVHRLKSAEEMQRNPRSKPRVWVTTVHGAVDLKDFHDQHGGGAYEFWGSVNGGLKTKIRIELDGEPKPRLFTPAPAAPYTPAVNGSLEAEKRIDRLERMLELLIARPQAAAPATGLKETVEALAVMHSMIPQATPGPGADMKTIFELVDRGIEIGQGREPAQAGEDGQASTVLRLAEVVAPLATRFLDQMAAGRRRPMPNPGPAPPPPPPTGHPGAQHTPTEPVSRAEVVEPDERARRVMQSRMIVLIDELAAGIREQQPVDEVADAVEVLVPPSDMAGILALPDAMVIQDIVNRASGGYPELDSDAGRAYMAAVLGELRRQDDPEVPPA